MRLAALFVLLASATLAGAQTNPAVPGPSKLPAARAETIRSECIHGRRMICGKILKVLPDGLVVDSGYSDLTRPPLNGSWLVSDTVTTTRPANLIEGKAPESIAVGLVYLTDLPKSRVKPKPYDYVVIAGYPAGETTYNSVGTVKRTLRCFTTTLPKAVQLNLAAETQVRTSTAAVK